MRTHKNITSFYMETLPLIAAFAVIILVLTAVFGGARVESVRAGRLTQAVILAERAAEAVSASESLEDVQALLDEDGNTQLGDDLLTVSNDEYNIEITWEPDGAVVSSTITVYVADEVIYTLDTAVFVQGAEK